MPGYFGSWWGSYYGAWWGPLESSVVVPPEDEPDPSDMGIGFVRPKPIRAYSSPPNIHLRHDVRIQSSPPSIRRKLL